MKGILGTIYNNIYILTVSRPVPSDLGGSFAIEFNKSRRKPID